VPNADHIRDPHRIFGWLATTVRQFATTTLRQRHREQLASITTRSRWPRRRPTLPTPSPRGTQHFRIAAMTDAHITQHRHLFRGVDEPHLFGVRSCDRSRARAKRAVANRGRARWPVRTAAGGRGGPCRGRSRTRLRSPCRPSSGRDLAEPAADVDQQPEDRLVPAADQRFERRGHDWRRHLWPRWEPRW